jgi:coenzyme F420-dependent glucose-6-phosphate dehydrogenase
MNQVGFRRGLESRTVGVASDEPPLLIGTSVLTPTMRYHPSIIAQNFATLACLNPGRVFLGVGTGEALNETPAT